MKKIIFFFIIITIFSCKKEVKKNDRLGVVAFQVTGNKESQDYFEKGLLLLHSFEYEDAREAFLEAQQKDPNMAMAYWGEAMTYNHSIWGEQDYDAGFLAVEKAINLKDAGTYSNIEQGFLEAVNVLYKPKTAKVERDNAYKDYMKSLHETYPENQEIAAFYAVSLLGSVPEGRDDVVYEQGAEIAKKVLKKNPKHPGALHYLIHSYDDPYHAELAIEAANSYSKVAPDASHALHMPSHIYVALGMWDDVITSNIDSYQASLNRMERKGLDNDARGYHAYHWLEYGYLQKGNFEKAKQMVLDMERYTKETLSDRSKIHLVFLKGTYLVETHQWNSPIADIEIDVSNLSVAGQAQYYFIEGYEAYAKNNIKDLEVIIETLSNEIDNKSLLVDNISDGFTVCSSLSRSEPTKMDIDQSTVMLIQLKALKAWLNNDDIVTEKLLQESITNEQKLSYSYGPPVIQKPTNELYADWLMTKEKYSEAIKQYGLTLERASKRRLALQGIEKATQLKEKEVEIE